MRQNRHSASPRLSWSVGFEMVIMTFGSGFQIENDSVSYLQRMKALNSYAADKGIAIGGYSLLASRGAKPKDAAISHHTGYPSKTREEGSRFGLSPCIASDRYLLPGTTDRTS